MREVSRIILHYLGEGDSRNYVTQGAVDAIRDYHINVNGWSDIGYHKLIDRDGHLYQGRDEAIVGAHAYGANTGSIGICCLYGTKDTGVTSATINTLVLLLRELCERYNIIPSSRTIIGHCDVMATQCPGIVYSIIPSVIGMVAQKPVVIISGKLDHPPETKEIGRMQVAYQGGFYEGLTINNQSYLPVTLIGKMLKRRVEWDNKKKIATII